MQVDKPLRLFLLLVFLAGMGSILLLFGTVNRYRSILSDGVGYYSYLPSYIINHDFEMEKLQDTLVAAKYRGEASPGGIFSYAGIERFPGTNKYLNKYNVGVSILVLPFFVIAHFFAKFSAWPADGFSLPYQFFASIAGLSYLTVGLYFIAQSLSRCFSQKIVLITLVCLVWGTPLFHYAVHDSLFSHVYSFALFSVLLWLVPKWHAGPNTRYSIYLGLVLGMIACVRTINIIAILIPLGYAPKITFWRKHIDKLAITALAGILAISPQLIIWYKATGTIIVDSYYREHFSFLSPFLLETLFSVRKGIFFWSPLLILSVPGFYFLKRIQRILFWPVALFSVSNLWVLSSWECWWYGVTFGQRAFVDSLAITALPLASTFDSLRTRLSKVFINLFAMLAVALSIFTMLLNWYRIMPGDNVTLRIYRSAITKMEPRHSKRGKAHSHSAGRKAHNLLQNGPRP